MPYFLLRRTLGRSSGNELAGHDPVPRAENVPAFMTASMQAVILRLREQEKELERLHKAERERAENTARLSEEVTRNMPAGLTGDRRQWPDLRLQSRCRTGAGYKGLVFRRFSEALGESSRPHQPDSAVHRGRKNFPTRTSRAHHAGRHPSRTRCHHLSDSARRAKSHRRHLPAQRSHRTGSLQKQMQLRENLAALGELSAGIAHEFKNALATISGYAQMIRSEPNAADTSRKCRENPRTDPQHHPRRYRIPAVRPPTGNLGRPVALRPLLDRIVCEIKELQPLVQITVDGDFAEIAGDEGLLRQAFLNLAATRAKPHPATLLFHP